MQYLLYFLFISLFSHLLTSPASAFSVKIHIYYANLIYTELEKNFRASGEYKITLISPNEKPAKVIYLDPEDAKAILANPEFFRGGAVGPDNTAFTGLTDPSHAAGTFPFQQCEGLKAAAKNGEERAYALGCFLHGVTDNVAHHMVNYFTQQTFTLNPSYRLAKTPNDKELRKKEGKITEECNIAEKNPSSGKVEKIRGLDFCQKADAFSSHDHIMPQDFTNVVKHILVEGEFERAVIQGLSTEEGAKYFTEPYLKHKLARRLYREAYLNPESQDYNMRTLMRPLIQRKEQFVKEYTDKQSALTGVVTVDGVAETYASIGSLYVDDRALKAIAEFVKTSGIVMEGNRMVVSNTGLAPYQYILLFPELINDVKKPLQRFAADVKSTAQGRCKNFSARPSCKLVKWLLTPDADYPQGRLEFLVSSRQQQLDSILDAHIESIERLSNHLVLSEKKLGAAELKAVFEPVDLAIQGLKNVPDNFFPPWVTLFGIPKFFAAIATDIKEKVVANIHEIVRAYVLELENELKLMLAPLAEKYKEEIEQLKATVREARRKVQDKIHREAGLEGKEFDVLEVFPKTVAHMNAYNSIVAVLANVEVVAPKKDRNYFSGPVSFDASYQLEYNQLALCPELRKEFYPCGISVTEMLQPNGFAKCSEITLPEGVAQPTIECYEGNKFIPATKPGKENCTRVEISSFMSGENHYVGSYTLSFPAKFAPIAPVCHNIKFQFAK